MRNKKVCNQTIEVSYFDLTVRVSCLLKGNGPPSLVFLHGLGCTKEIFQQAYREPALARFQLLSFDLVGFGDSSKPEPQLFDYSLERHAEICRLVLDAFQMREAHLVGHSMGGAIGLILIHKDPSQISSFFNLEGNLVGEDCFFSREVIRSSMDHFVDGGIERSVSRLHKAASDPIVLMGLRKSDPAAFYKSCESLVQWSDRGRLLGMFKDLTIRKFYVFGEKNARMPILSFLQDTPKIGIRRSAHFMMLENPQEFYARLAATLA